MVYHELNEGPPEEIEAKHVPYTPALAIKARTSGVGLRGSGRGVQDLGILGCELGVGYRGLGLRPPCFDSGNEKLIHLGFEVQGSG